MNLLYFILSIITPHTFHNQYSTSSLSSIIYFQIYFLGVFVIMSRSQNIPWKKKKKRHHTLINHAAESLFLMVRVVVYCWCARRGGGKVGLELLTKLILTSVSKELRCLRCRSLSVLARVMSWSMLESIVSHVSHQDCGKAGKRVI